jgi:hypothetical protein
VVVVLFYVKIYCFDGFKSVKLLLAAAFVEKSSMGVGWSKLLLIHICRFGTAPTTSELSDTIWIVLGASDPLLLRPTGDSDHFQLVGYVYLHGFDLDNVLQNETLNWQDFILE